jgi:hypothetical protein
MNTGMRAHVFRQLRIGLLERLEVPALVVLAVGEGDDRVLVAGVLLRSASMCSSATSTLS